MNFKTLTLALLTLSFLFEVLIHILNGMSTKRPIPANMAEVYDGESYATWQRYYREKNQWSMISSAVIFLLNAVLLATNAYAGVLNALGVSGDYVGCIVVMLTQMVLEMVASIPVELVDTFRVEEKYGFNKMTLKTFWLDCVKDLALNGILTCGIVCLFVLLHRVFGNWLLLVFTGAMLLVVLALVFLSPLMTRLHNKLEPLPEGSLRSRLEELLTSNGCVVKQICVMDGSKRSTKANAAFSGLGRSKTIMLYDTLLEQMTEDEIVAVFAHEMGHNKHKDTAKLFVMNGVNFALMGLVAWALVNIPAIYPAFGFEKLNYGFAFLLAGVILGVLNPLIGLISNGLSRKFEYAADGFAAENGFAEALCSGLKKLERNSFGCLNPHPMLVAIYYSHPTVSQRVAALEARK